MDNSQTQHLINLCRSSNSLCLDNELERAIAAKNGDRIDARLRQLSAVKQWSPQERMRAHMAQPGILTCADAASMVLTLFAVQSNLHSPASR